MTTAVALPNDTPSRPSIATFIETLRPEIARALPSGQDATRIARIALTAVRKSELAAMKAGNPRLSLANCTVESFAGALLTAAALGLEPGTEEAHLVPYAGECTLIIDYRGIAKLFYQHPLAADLSAEYVCERDEFDYQKGTDPYLRHKPATGDRGEIVAYYAVARLTNGATKFEALTPEQCKALRQGKVGPSASFQAGDPEHWMERKTVVKQLAKLLPKSTTFARALNADERPGSELRAEVPQVQAIAAAPETEHDDWEPGEDPQDATPQDWSRTLITNKQQSALHAALGELRITTRESIHTFCGDTIGHPVSSTTNLTRDQASACIDAANAAVQRMPVEDPPEPMP